MKVQRYSQQRERIYQAVRNSREHPTAQMVYDALRPELPKLSLGTVYRNLQQMADEGRLVQIDGAVTRFDAVLAPHTHLCCARCGRVEDDMLPYDAALDCTARAEGWTITGHSLTFTGICPACAGE